MDPAEPGTSRLSSDLPGKDEGPRTSPVEPHEGFHTFPSTVHPMLIPSVAQIVLAHLGVKDLKSVRTVCNVWGEEGTKLLAEKAWIRIFKTTPASAPWTEILPGPEGTDTDARGLDGNGSLEYFLEGCKLYGTNSPKRPRLSDVSDVAEEKVTYLGGCSLLSAKKMNIHLHESVTVEQDGRNRLTNLFQSMGSRFHSLSLGIEVCYEHQVLLPVRRSEVPHLRSIQITDVFDGADTLVKKYTTGLLQGYPSDTAWRAILASYPRHELPNVLNLSIIQTKEHDASVKLRAALVRVQEFALVLLKRLPNLQVFEMKNTELDYSIFCTILPPALNREVDEDDIVRFAMGLPLRNVAPVPSLVRSLKAFQFPLDLNEDAVIQLLSGSQIPLEHLQVLLRPGLRFPALYTWLSSLGATLTKLDLNFVLIPPSPETFPCGSDLVNLKVLKFTNYMGPLDFLPSLRHLKTLVLDNVNLSLAFPLEPIENCPSLRFLEIISAHSNAGRITPAQVYRNIGSYFPNLTRFSADHLLDSNLKAIIELCPVIEELIARSGLITDDSIKEDINRPQTAVSISQPSGAPMSVTRISSLNRLKRLHLHSPTITDSAIQDGLAECLSLQELCLSSREISLQALEKLLLSMPNLTKINVVLTHSYKIAGGRASEEAIEFQSVATEEEGGMINRRFITFNACTNCES